MAKHKTKRKIHASSFPSKRQKTVADRGAAHDSVGRAGAKAKHSQPSQHPPDVPFKNLDDVLLVGEGDFSFAHCIYSHYGRQCASLTATSLDPEQDVFAKYPQAASYLSALRPSDSLPPNRTPPEKDTFGGLSPDAETTQSTPSQHPAVRILHDIDATRLNATRAVRSERDGYDWIVFQFPHVGGKSTDVNRQVRSNQQLLVGFFEKARGMLRPRGRQEKARSLEDWEETGENYTSEASDGNNDLPARSSDDGQGGRVLVTLFEGEPYTLWNIRDLARHCGYVVERSWSFRWEAFPGYSHARTLGNIKSRREREGFEDTEDARSKKGAWKGDERQARTFCFHVKPEEDGDQPSKRPKKQKKHARTSDSSDDDSGLDV